MNNPSRAIPLIAIGALLWLPDAFAQSNLTALQRRLVSGFVSHEFDQRAAANAPAFISPLAPSGASALLAPSGTNAPLAGPATSYHPAGSNACQQTFGSNVKVNQNCLNLSDPDLQGRGQAQNETAIAADPSHPNHLVAAFNDYRRGDGSCGVAFSVDGGQHWNDGLAPVGFTRGSPFAREYWQANGDPSVAWDTQGNAYLSCQSFNRGNVASADSDQSSAVYVLRSTQNNGASWNFPGRPVVVFLDPAGTSGVLEDKPYMAVDNTVGSPFQDRIYVTWTEFAADGTAYIYEVHSSDYGETFSPRALVSSNSPVCVNTFGAATPLGNCNENQYSQPFTGADGALYVVYANFNNATVGQDNRNQLLLVKSTDGGASFGAPVKVADYYDLPDCDTYQGAGADPFRSCIPEKGPTSNSVFRASNYPSGAVNPRNPQQITVSFGSYINQRSNESTGCVPAGFATDGLNLYTGTKTAGACANQILVSASSDAGATFTGGTQDPRVLAIASLQKKGTADAFFQWAAYTRSGAFAVSYFDRQYGDDALTGSSDVSASWTDDGKKYSTARATSSSMPPPTQFGGASGGSQFYGDYAGLAAVNDLHPIWMDTRNAELFLCPGTGAPGVPPQVCKAAEPNGLTANDQEVFTTSIQR